MASLGNEYDTIANHILEKALNLNVVDITAIHRRSQSFHLGSNQDDHVSWFPGLAAAVY